MARLPSARAGSTAPTSSRVSSPSAVSSRVRRLGAGQVRGGTPLTRLRLSAVWMRPRAALAGCGCLHAGWTLGERRLLCASGVLGAAGGDSAAPKGSPSVGRLRQLVYRRSLCTNQCADLLTSRVPVVCWPRSDPDTQATARLGDGFCAAWSDAQDRRRGRRNLSVSFHGPAWSDAGAY